LGERSENESAFGGRAIFRAGSSPEHSLYAANQFALRRREHRGIAEHGYTRWERLVFCGVGLCEWGVTQPRVFTGFRTQALGRASEQ
jgi:hypothetical protein